MTKKGTFLLILIIIMLSIIAINVVVQYKEDKSKEDTEVATKSSMLYLNDETGFDIEKLKSYKLPILIQVGSKDDEISKEMMSDVENLYNEMENKAIIRYIDIKDLPKLFEETNLSVNNLPIQILLCSDGNAYDAGVSEALGYKVVKDTAGNEIYTLHYGDLTLSEMRQIVQSMNKGENK